MTIDQKLQLLDLWCRNHRYKSMGTAMAILRNNKAEAEDAMQNALIKAARRIETYNPDMSPFPAWMNQIVVNSCRDRARSLSRHHAHCIAIEEMRNQDVATLTPGCNFDPDENPLLQDPRVNVESEVIEVLFQQELRGLIEESLKSLGPDQAAIMRSIYLEDVPRKDVAELAGISYTALVQRIRRIRGRLKGTLQECLPDL